MPHRIDMLRRLQGRLLDIMKAAGPLFSSSPANANLEALQHLRAEMAEALANYQEFVHRDIFEHAASEGTADELSDALDLRLSCIQLQRDYAYFCSQWARKNALGSWMEYRLGAVRMMKQVRDHVRHAQEPRSCQIMRRVA